jgi:hypothetical protein
VAITNDEKGEADLLTAALSELAGLLPKSWQIDRPNFVSSDAPAGLASNADAVVGLRAPNGTNVTFAVEVKESFAPRDLERLLGGLSRTLRQIAGYIPVLLVARWLSPRTHQLLEAEQINFIDLTGNTLIILENPALYVRTQGARRDPWPAQRGRARLRGPKAARLIRLLADVEPPYGVTELATAARLNAGYVSTLLEVLDREAIVERVERGRVESVDVEGLLTMWADSYDVLRSNRAQTFLAPSGAAQALARLATQPRSGRVAVTGSFAAGRIAPVAAAALLLLYTEQPEEIIEMLGLLRSDDSGNVALLQPFDPVVWERTVPDSGLEYVSVSQLTVDCLTGTGRMPAEGAAVLEWMKRNEPNWRLRSLAETRDPPRAPA